MGEMFLSSLVENFSGKNSQTRLNHAQWEPKDRSLYFLHIGNENQTESYIGLKTN